MGIDSLNTNYYNSFLPIGTSFSTDSISSNFPISAFDGYFTNSSSLGMGFMGLDIMNQDFMSVFLKNQQLLMSMFLNSPSGFNVGMPNFNNLSGLSSSDIKQKVASMPLSKDSAEKIKGISERLNCDPKDLAAVIYAESGGNPQAVNKQSGATGLIQFMPKTAAWLGTSTQELLNMPADKQLDYVEKYLTLMKNSAVKSGKLSPGAKLDAGTLYTLVFMPAKAGQEVVCSGGKALSQNMGIAQNNVITKTSLSNKLSQFKNQVGKLFS